MNKVLISIGAGVLAGAMVCSAHALAADAHHMTPQQSKFAVCAHKSKGLKRKAHTAFMRACLKGDKKAAAQIKAKAKAAKDNKDGGPGHAG